MHPNSTSPCRLSPLYHFNLSFSKGKAPRRFEGWEITCGERQVRRAKQEPRIQGHTQSSHSPLYTTSPQHHSNQNIFGHSCLGRIVSHARPQLALGPETPPKGWIALPRKRQLAAPVVFFRRQKALRKCVWLHLWIYSDKLGGPPTYPSLRRPAYTKLDCHQRARNGER